MKKTFNDVLADIEKNLVGKTLHGISGTASAFTIVEVDYQNNNVVLDVQGKRKTWTFERLEKVWKEMYYRPAANVEVVFGGSGSSRNQVETIYANLGYVEWLYVKSKKCIAYVGDDTHPYGELKHMDEDKEVEYQGLMMSTNPRNPILSADENFKDASNNEYVRAAGELCEYADENGVALTATKDEIYTALQEFQNHFSPEKLQELSEDDILQYIFYTTGDNTNSLCCWLEMNKDCRNYFGSISGGSAYKFGLFQKKETGIWMTGSPQKPQELSEEEARKIGIDMRDALVRGATIIRNASINTLEDCEKMDADLQAAIGTQYYNWSWFHKYFSMICPEKLSGFHSTDWQMHILRAMRIVPSEKYYGRSGQIAMVQNNAKWLYREFFDVTYAKFGNPRQFVRLGTSDSSKNYAAEWAKRGVLGIGWRELGKLSEYTKGESIDRKEIQEKLREIYYPNDERTASRKAGEVSNFYKSDINTVFVLMDGEQLIALADDVGSYFYDETSPMAHLKTAKWKFPFEENEKMPEKSEGKMTSCYPLTKEDNILYLYDKYYYSDDLGDHLTENVVSESGKKVRGRKPNYHTGLYSRYERNRIVFGAPGTGKSYQLKTDCEKELNGTVGDYERVTFHPDYSYSKFVGTYKPVTDSNGTIKYTFVPGPFMRLYVQAIKSGWTKTPQPFLLIIEEINRANVAAVFGDIFQLLDRDDDGVSEYDIHASEDVKNYLAGALDGRPEDYQKIKIPDNMFIWATMNSADQGVFPMDTAFKRRWNFEYLGINENEKKISGIGKIELAGSDEPVEWNILRKAINAKMSSEQFKINEDKLMGPFFLSKKIIVSDENGMIIDTDKFVAAFKSKVIMYLYEDAVKQGKHRFFDGCDNSKYSSVCDAFDELGMGIFGPNFKENFYDKQRDEA